jgi:hypothetical protein
MVVLHGALRADRHTSGKLHDQRHRHSTQSCMHAYQEVAKLMRHARDEILRSISGPRHGDVFVIEAYSGRHTGARHRQRLHPGCVSATRLEFKFV